MTTTQRTVTCQRALESGERCPNVGGWQPIVHVHVNVGPPIRIAYQWRVCTRCMEGLTIEDFQDVETAAQNIQIAKDHGFTVSDVMLEWEPWGDRWPKDGRDIDLIRAQQTGQQMMDM